MLLQLLNLPVIAGPDAPVPPGWWPVPPGWWLLGLALFLVLLRAAYAFLRPFLHVVKNRHNRELPVRFRAMAALDELANRPSLGAREAAYRLNEILRTALFNERMDARDGVIEDQDIWQQFWQELELRYQPVMPADNEDVDRWLTLARGWIARLPTDDTTVAIARRNGEAIDKRIAALRSQ